MVDALTKSQQPDENDIPDPEEWICSHHQRKDFKTFDELLDHKATCYVDFPGYWEMTA